MFELSLDGVVGVDFTAASVAAQLRTAEGRIKATLNSGGGVASEGAAIFAVLSSYPAKVDIEIIGIAASAASLVAMAGENIIMRAGAVMMIHDPLNITIGNSADHAKMIEELESYARSYARIYAGKSGKSESAARAIMQAETWFDGPEAVAAGFATATDSRQAKAFASYDYAKHYQHADAAFAHADPGTASWKRVISEYNHPVVDRSVHWVK